jgi:DNA-binding PucR family transcriptional regulator
MIGIAVRRPEPVAGVCAGVGPPARLAELPAAFALAGVFSLSDLSIRPAILIDAALGDAFVARYLEPLAELGRLGDELETTLRAWFDRDMRIDETAQALHMHANTLRHRLRRFEEATQTNLRSPADLAELWWALERRRLEGQRLES